MSDAAKHAEDQKFQAQIDAISGVLTAEITALAWALVAKVIAEELPTTFAVGSLSWKDKPKKARVILPVKRYAVSKKVVILGPKPKERAERYQQLLNRRSGKWARRDGSVMYTVCDIKNSQTNRAFYKMRRLDNGVEKWIKFTSIVSDWKHVP